MNTVLDPNQSLLTESQIAALVVDENCGPVQLNFDFLKVFKLTERLAGKILCALCELDHSQTNSSNNAINGGQQQQQQGGKNGASVGGTSTGEQTAARQLDLIKGFINNHDLNNLVGRLDTDSCLDGIDVFADYCRQNNLSLQQLLQTFDDATFASDRLFRNTNYLLQSPKQSSVQPLTSFRKFWHFCTNLAATDKNGLSVVGRVFFNQVWEHNPLFQLNFIVNCIEQNLISRIFLQTPQQQSINVLQQQQQSNLSQIVPYSDLLKCQPDFEAIPELNNWKFQRLYQILIDFTAPGNISSNIPSNLSISSNCFARALDIFQWPLQYCPDLTVLGLLGVVGPASTAKVEILCSAIPTFLNASHPNAAIILHSIWSNDSHSSTDPPPTALVQQKVNAPLTWSQKTLLQALAEHYTKSPQEEQQQRLSRILDVAQDIKTLFRLLDGTCYPFVIDLACLASRREYLKLDKWLMDKFTENGENFIRALCSFLTRRYLPLLNRSSKDSAISPASVSGPTLPAETLAVMLTFLQQCVMPPSGPLGAPFTELSQTVKNEVFELIGNSSIMLQRAPRHPPPGVTSITNDNFNRVLVGSYPMERPALSEVDKLQAEFEANRLAAQNQRIQRIVKPSQTVQAPVTRPSIANNPNIDNLLAASDEILTPSEVIQDKVSFIVNNLSLVNLKQKTGEFLELFGGDDTHYEWIARYFSQKRAALEQNFQPLYANFLYELKNPKLIEAMTRETYKNIKHLLCADKKADNINERTVLKNLGQWLGLLTLARNKPILHVDLDLKGLLVEAYHKGTQELLFVVPFLAEILKTTQKSKIFKPNNPFVLGLLRALVELRQQPNLKLNLEFQVEVLFNNLGVDLNKLVGQSNILNDEKYYSKIECQLGSKQISVQQSPQPLIQQSMKAQLQQSGTSASAVGSINSVLARQNEFGATLSPMNTPPLMTLSNSSSIANQVGASMPANFASTPVSWSSKFKYTDLDVTNTACLNNLATIQSNIPIFNLQPNLKGAVRPAIESAISEWLPSILEKSLKICLSTVDQIVRKDFALVPDENHMQRAAQYLVRHLVSYMAMILCRDPEQVEATLTTNLKVAFMRACPTLRKEQAEHAALLIASDNLDLARAFIIKTVIEKATADIDKSLQNEYELRRIARLEGRSYVDPTYLAFHSKLMSEGLRLKPAPMAAEQMHNYEEIGHNIAGFKKYDGPFSDSTLGSTSPFNDINSALSLQNIIPSTTTNIGKASPIGASNLNAANIVNQLINNRVNLTPTQFTANQNAPMPNFGMNDLYLLQQQIELQSALAAMQSTSGRGQSNYLGQQGAIGSTGNPFANTSPQLQSSNTSSNLLQQRETPDGDPPGLVERTEKLLRDWVIMHQSGQTTKMFPIFVQQMTVHGILKTDDLVTRFFRLSTEMCVESCYRVLATQSNGPNSLELRNKCYETLDAFTTLIVLLIKNSGSSNSSNIPPEVGTAAKINLLSKILNIIVSVAIKDQETRRAEFQHLAYYRILIILFIELNLSPPMLGLPTQSFTAFNQLTASDIFADNVQFQVLFEFSKTLRMLKPSRVPSFAFAWLDFLSHRLFVEKCLGGQATNRPVGSILKGWALYAQLLIDLIKFEAPFLRNVELPPSVDLLYKGTLKMFLVLLHDFPEFLCEYCYSLCDVIPCNAIQLRNLVLSAFPRKMRLPDPFTPNLKIDQLPEMSQPPKTSALQTNLISSVSFKDELDSYLKTRTPVSFLSNLIGYLRAQPIQIALSLDGSKMNSLNVPLLNSLVIYVGQSAIAAIHPRPISMTTISGTTQMDVFQHLATTLDTEGRYLFLNAIANQLRYPNSHTHYFSSALLYLFAVAPSEQIQEQITRVLVERLIIMRPHPWGLLVTFIELIKNRIFKFWDHDFVRCAPEIEKLFQSVARSCCVTNSKASDVAYRGN